MLFSEEIEATAVKSLVVGVLRAVPHLCVRPRSQDSLKPFYFCVCLFMVAISPHPLLMLMGEVQRILGSTSLSHSKLRASKGRTRRWTQRSPVVSFWCIHNLLVGTL
jgi:hypothetical protein